MPDPPMATNIEVCEGESTLISPVSGGGGGMSASTVYAETFDTDDEGVAGSCTGTAASTCATNIAPANGQWSIGGDVSGLTATSDFATTSGGALVFQDTDTEVCFMTSTIDISGCTTSDFTVDLSELGTMEATDYVDVNLMVDGVSNPIPNWLGLGDASHTLIDDFTATTVSQTGIVGSTIVVQICVMNNAGTEQTLIDNIEVGCEASAGGAITFKYYDMDPTTGAAPIFGPTAGSYDPMTAVGTSDNIWITACDATGESAATMITVTVNALPSAPTAMGAVYCDGDAILDVVPVGEAGAIFSYYSDAALMTLIQTGASFTPNGMVGTETIFITQAVNGCESEAVEVVIEVLPTPAAPMAESAVFCIGEPVGDIEAVGDPTATFTFYSDAALTAVIANGPIYTPMGTPGVETVFVTQTVNACESPATTVTITIAGFENITVAPTCNEGVLDYCLDITFDFAGPSPSNMFEVVVNGFVFGPFPYGTTGMEALTICDPANFIGDEQMDLVVEIADVDRGNVTAGITQTGGGSSNLEGCVEIASILPAQSADNNGDGVVDFCDEFITLTNGGTAIIDISGYTISDAVAIRHIFPTVTILNPGQTITLFNSDFNQIANCAGSGIWNNGGDDVILNDASGGLVDMETYTGSTNGVEITFEVIGCGMGTTTNTGASSCLRINSVMANQTADNDGDGMVDFCDEFITITNPGNQALDISGYTISDGVALRHVFPTVTILNPGQILTIFNSDLNQVANCAGGGVWNNGGDDIVIADATGAAVDMQTYGGSTAGVELFFSLDPCPVLEVDPSQVCSGLMEFDEPNCCPVIEVASLMGMSLCAGSCPAAGEGLMASGDCGNIAASSMTRWFSDPAGMFLVFEGDVFDPISEGLVDNDVAGTTVFYAQVSCDFCLSELVPIKVEIFDCEPPSDGCGGCTYFVQLYDSAFNGWDGAQFLVSINEGPFVEYKPTTADNGCLFFPIDIVDGGSIDYMYHAGANAEEHSYKIIDALGQVVASEGMQFTGNNIEAGVEQTIKADCPACCEDAAEQFTFVFTAGQDAFEKSWEIRDNNGVRVAFANAGEYAGLFNGQSVSTNLLLDPCEEYTITTFAARNNGWEGGTYQLLSTNPERGLFLMPDVYQVAQGPDTFNDEISTDFTLPCSIECPVEETILADDTDNCILTAYTAPIIEAPICSPNNCHFNPTPTLQVCYPTAIGGLVEGPLGTTSASLPVGTNPVVYKVTYGDGQIRRCTSQVHVISEVNPVLACNDFLIVPLLSNANNCETIITADMILENPDPCNAQYLIELVDANGNTMGNVVDNTAAGQTFTFSVTQIGTGLSAMCDGELLIEDKLAPIFQCFDYEINCNHPNALDELYTHTETFEVTPGELPGNIAGGTAMNPSELLLPIPDVGCGPHGEIIQDINVDINLVHNDLEDLTIILFAPNGTSITLLDRRTCNNQGSQNLNVTFDSESNTPVFTACSPGFPGLSGALAPAQPLSLLYNLPYEDLQGDWSILIRDDDDTVFEGIGVGEVISASIEITAGFPLPFAADDCNLESVTLIFEEIVDTACDQSEWLGANIVRVWEAIDAFGNISQCTQTVGLRAPRFADLNLPEDIELECGDVPSDPAFLTPELSGEQFFECFIVEESQTNLCDVVITYIDKVSPLCGNGYQITRSWEIANLCSNTVLEHEQTIIVQDNFGPVIAQGNIVVGTNEEACSANLDLVDLSIEDCSEVSTVTATYFIGSSLTIVDLTNGDIIEDLPFGANTVTLSASDACGNETTEEVIITVVDDIDPTAVCNEELNITLNNAGTASITAADFDEGSLDNCSDVTLLVRSLGCEGAGFAPTAAFGCCDVGIVVVELLATDAAGNSNVCWAEVLVEDGSAPTITCQADLTINCDDDVHGPDLFEAPDASDNCNTSITESEVVAVELPNCAQLLSKTYTVSDGSDKTDDVSCTQTITIEHVSDFIVQFPADQEFDACELGEIPGPIVSEDECENIGTTVIDRVFTQVEDACYKIERTYTIVNHCIVENPSAGGFSDLGTPLPIPRTFRDDDGYFQYTQIIKVQDTDAPMLTFTAPDPCDFTDACEGALVLTATGEDDCADLVDLTFTWKIDAGSSGAFEIEGTGADASGVYPYGDHIIKWTVTDGCGNMTSEEFEFSVQDCKNPTPICDGVATVVMNDGGCVHIQAAHLLLKAEDNCTIRTDEEWMENARIRFADSNEPLSTFVEVCCADIFLGNVPVEIWVEDEAGNADFCIVNINIQDNIGACDDSGIGAATLIGSIQTEIGAGISEVDLFIDGQNRAMTNYDGDYGIQLATGNSYKVEPIKLDNPGKYISTFDIVLIAQHVLQVNSLNSPYKIIAADIDQDGAIDIFDLLEIRQMVLFLIDEFTVADSWVFIPAEYSFQNPANPLNEDFPLFMDVDLNSDQARANFIAVKMGDADDSASFLRGENVEERNFPKALSFVLQDEIVQAGQQYRVDFKASDFKNINGYQFTLGFDPTKVEILDFEEGALNINAGHFGKALLELGRLTSSFNVMGDAISVADNEVLFSINMVAKQNIKLSEVLTIVEEYTLPESYQGSDVIGLDLVFENINLDTESNFALYQNTPNPFKDQTLISFELPKSMSATLTIYDLSGKVLYQLERDFDSGYNSVEIDANYLKANGLVYYTLEADEYKAERKMLIIK